MVIFHSYVSLPEGKCKCQTKLDQTLSMYSFNTKSWSSMTWIKIGVTPISRNLHMCIYVHIYRINIQFISRDYRMINANS